MTAPAIDLTQYANTKVLARFDTDDAELVKGTVTAATPQGIIFKAYGKSNADLFPANRIRHIEVQADSEPELKARRMDPVSVKNVKRHLIDRHCYNPAEVNPMTPEAALQFHDETLDHAVLGHFHAEPPAKPEKDEAATTE